MQKVSSAYKKSMKSLLRNRGYIMVSFGLLNQEAQAKATVGEGDFTYFSDKQNVFKDREIVGSYATLEENFTKVDGSMLMLPRSGSSVFYDTGLTSETLVSDGEYSFEIQLNTLPTDFKGITIDFGDNYAVDFDLIFDSGEVAEIRGNDKAIYVSEQVFEGVTAFTLKAYSMKYSQNRLRVKIIRFGYGLVYYNDSVISSQLDSYVSPIGADVPQIDFSVTLKNYDHYFNIDNPNSAINYLETGQEMEVYYGYELPSGEVEWVKGNHLLCSEWESDDFTATIRSQDVFRNMDSEYYKGRYVAEGKSFYDLTLDVLADAEIEDYYIDPRLKYLYTKNPIPRVKHKEALQIIANACRCALTQTRNGEVQIKSNFVPEATASANNEAWYSNASEILKATPKEEYASLALNYTPVNGGVYFLPREEATELHYTGFVSEAISDAEGKFAENPIITVVQEVAYLYYGVRFVFGYALPAEFVIRTYNAGEIVEEYTVDSDIQKKFVLVHTFNDFDTMQIEFTKTANPYNRIVLNQFAFGDITEFTMTRTDMTSSPKAIKQESIKDVIVPCYSYQLGTQEDNLITEEVTVAAGEERTFYIGEPAYDFRVSVEGLTDGASIVESGSYYIKVAFAFAGTHKLSVYGYRYKITEQYAVSSLNNRGKTVKWENPLVSDMEIATDLSQWLADYYTAGIEYEYDTRGNPEIDANDIVYQENEFRSEMKVNIYRQTLNFAQAFSGKVTARRVEG